MIIRVYNNKSFTDDKEDTFREFYAPRVDPGKITTA
jgi:hypothetical protein